MRLETIDHQLKVLDYWWLLELFNSQNLPKLTSDSGDPEKMQVVEWRKGDTLPWADPNRHIPRKEGRVWRYSVYLGVYELENTYQYLHAAFMEDRDAYDSRPAGKSACARLVIDENGQLVPESSVLSSALWAVGRIEKASDKNEVDFRGFLEAADEFIKDIGRYESSRCNSTTTQGLPTYDESALWDLLKICQQASGIDSVRELATEGVVIKSQLVSDRESDGAPDEDFLNSFFLDDIHAVRGSIEDRGSCGKALSDYLTPDESLDPSRRVDVMTDDVVVDAGVAVERLPKGRWPANPEHGLALRQQFAVNQALRELACTSGLMGVNGPPGTGKTTMLRDILAGNVVERARRLASLAVPDQAFTDKEYVWESSNGYRRCVPQLRPELTGFEMVVASSNNGAVENVTKEIPVREALDSRWADKADYFAGIASEILDGRHNNNGSAGGERPTDAWGVVAACLGRKVNRNNFYSRFWFKPRNKDITAVRHEDGNGMHEWLKQQKSGVLKSWGQARAEFTQAEHRVDRLLVRRRDAESRRRQLPLVEQECKQLKTQISDLEEVTVKTESQISQYSDILKQVQADVDLVESEHNQIAATKPGLLEVIFSLGRVSRQRRAKVVPYEERLYAAYENRQKIQAEKTVLDQQLDRLLHQLDTIRTVHAQTQGQLNALRSARSEDREKYGIHYPGAVFGEDRELHTPWLDAELDAARSELFLAALQLHKDFIANTANRMDPGLCAAMDVIKGNCPYKLEPEKRLAAWQLFFLVVPLVSTTFASVGRMFGNIGPESIGWLLIDEAGQACPQHAVGGIWRAKRVIAVGDPLQLQPVVTMPRKAQRSIAAPYGISSDWMPPQASVQTLADRVSRYGTELRQTEGNVWVSAPLTVHRRCDNPMFDLCNNLAYNGIMVNGVYRRLDDPNKPDLYGGPERPIIWRSFWADTPATENGKHFQGAQIDRLGEALQYLCGRGISTTDIIAISPFREVAKRLEGLASSYPGLRGGTIHTAQGREADVVFLVLGGAPNKPGAKAWASESVNLVNVAASRAKRRLYVIGDWVQWSKFPYFKELSEVLERVPEKGASNPSP